MIPVIAVFVGGGLGSVCRWAIGLWLSKFDILPVITGTFVANLLSSIALGYLLGMAEIEKLSLPSMLLLMTGFCGGFSTFSTFGLELYQFLKMGSYMAALGYIGASIMAGVIGVWFGMLLFKSW